MQAHPADSKALAPTARAWWALVAVQLCFASFPATGKIALAGFPPHVLCFWRVAGTALVLGAFALWRHGSVVLLKREDIFPAIVLSLLGVTLNQLFFLSGLAQSSAVRGGLLVMLIPVFTLGWAVLRKREQFSVHRLAGVLAAATGVLLLLWDSLFGSVFGADWLFLANAACYAIYLVEVRRLLQRYPALVVAAWMFVFALPPVSVLVWNDALWPSASTSAQHWALAWVVVFPTIFAYLLNICALQRIPASTTAVFVCFQPLAAAALAMVLLGEALNWRDGATFVLVVCGIWLSSRDSVSRKRG